MFRCQNIPCWNVHGAENSFCQNVPVPKSPCVKMSMETKCPCAGMSAGPKHARAEMSWWWNVHTEMSLAEMSGAKTVGSRTYGHLHPEVSPHRAISLSSQESADSKTMAIVTAFAPDKIFVWFFFYLSLFSSLWMYFVRQRNNTFFKDLPYKNCWWWFLKVLHYWRHLVERKMWSDVNYTPMYSLGICDCRRAKRRYTSLNLLNFFRV